MPGFPWLAETQVDASTIQNKLRALRLLGHPYSDEEIENAPSTLANVTEIDALIAYLQVLGTNNNGR